MMYVDVYVLYGDKMSKLSYDEKITRLNNYTVDDLNKLISKGKLTLWYWYLYVTDKNKTVDCYIRDKPLKAVMIDKQCVLIFCGYDRTEYNTVSVGSCYPDCTFAQLCEEYGINTTTKHVDFVKK